MLGCESRARGVFDGSAVSGFEEENIPQQCLKQAQTWKFDQAPFFLWQSDVVGVCPNFRKALDTILQHPGI